MADLAAPRSTASEGPRVERKKWGGFKHLSGAKYDMVEDPDGEWGDAWYYDDELIYVQKKFVAIPQASTTVDDKGNIAFDRTQMTMTAITYDDMRKGCWDRDERVKDLALNYTDGSLPFPTFPRFCGQTFYEAKDKELGLACVKANNDWMVEEWCEPSGGVQHPALPHPAVGRRACRGRDQAQRRARASGPSPSARSRPASKLPEHQHRLLGPAVGGLQRLRRHGVHARRLVVSSTRSPRPTRTPPSACTLGFNNAMASLADWLFSGNLLRFPKLKLAYSEGQIGWIPYVLERADTVWEMHDSWIHAKERIPVPPSTQYYGRIFGCFTADRHGLRSLEEVGEDNICFETDYPHTDTTWPYSEAYIEKLCAGLDDEVAYKILRGNAIKMLELDRV